MLEHLNEGKPARTFPATDEQRELMRDWFLLTSKPVIYAANIGEGDLGGDVDELPLVKQVDVYKRQYLSGSMPGSVSASARFIMARPPFMSITPEPYARLPSMRNGS